LIQFALNTDVMTVVMHAPDAHPSKKEFFLGFM